MPHLSALSLALNRPGAVGVAPLTPEQQVAALFANNEQGAWYDTSDYSLMMQDRIGTTVTNVEQPVGIIFDKRLGATLGAELVDTMNSSTAAWTSDGNTISVSIDNEITITYAVAPASWAVLSAAAGLSSNLTVGKWYTLTAEAKVNSGSSVQVFLTTDARIDGPSITSTSYVPVRFDFLATNATTTIWGARQMASGEAITFRNISVKLRDGNHAYQTGSTARPVLRARYNLLTYSEQFNNAAWNANFNVTVTANDITAPDGTLTADKIAETASGSFTNCGQTHVAIATEYTFSVYAKKGSSATKANVFRVRNNTSAVNLVSARVNYDTGAVTYLVGSTGVTATAVGDWWRIAITVSTGITIGNTLVFYAAFGGADAATGTDYAYVWGADLRVGTSAGDYQRIASGTFPADYATTSTITGQPFRPYLHFDGADGLLTANVDFTSTDAVSMCMGEQQLGAYAAVEVGFELSGNSGSSGAFAYFSEFSPTPIFRSNGGTQANATAPSSSLLARVASGRADISDDVCILRINGAQVASVTTDQGAAASYVNQPLYIGSRSGIQFPMSGNIYGLLVRGGPSTTDNLQTMETYMAGKTGVTL